MNNLMTRNLQLVCSALDNEEIRYFSTPQKLIAYTPCKANPKHRALRPITIRVTISPNDSGILFEASLPVCLQVATENERELILKRIAKENYGTIRGGLTFAENNRLNYRLFYLLGEDAACFDAEEVAACVKLCAAALSDGYEVVINALDENDNDVTDDSDDTPEGINAELEALFDRLFSSHAESGSMFAAKSENDSTDSVDGNEDVSSDEDTDIDPSLRSMLDDFLNDETDAE